MQPEDPDSAARVHPLDPDTTPFPPATYATTGRLGWAGIEAIRFHNPPASVVSLPPMTHHTLILFRRPPRRFEVRTEGICRNGPPPADSIIVVPAGRPARWRWEGSIASLHVFLEPGVFDRAAEGFGLDPERLEVPPLDGVHLPGLRAAMLAVGDEMGGAAGNRLAAESLAVHLARHASVPRVMAAGPDGRLPRARLGAVVDYVEAHPDSDLTLADMAAVAHLSAYHFARQFKAATGLPPHRYVVARRVERARELLGTGGTPLAEVAACAGFSDQSQFTRHFKRAVGVTPGQYRKSTTAKSCR